MLQIKTENRQLLEKNERYENHVRVISKQLYELNVQNLDLKKENEIAKNKLRLAENNPRDSRLLSAPIFGKFFLYL